MAISEGQGCPSLFTFGGHSDTVVGRWHLHLHQTVQHPLPAAISTGSGATAPQSSVRNCGDRHVCGCPSSVGFGKEGIQRIDTGGLSQLSEVVVPVGRPWSSW